MSIYETGAKYSAAGIVLADDATADAVPPLPAPIVATLAGSCSSRENNFRRSVLGVQLWWPCSNECIRSFFQWAHSNDSSDSSLPSNHRLPYQTLVGVVLSMREPYPSNVALGIPIKRENARERITASTVGPLSPCTCSVYERTGSPVALLHAHNNHPVRWPRCPPTRLNAEQ